MKLQTLLLLAIPVALAVTALGFLLLGQPGDPGPLAPGPAPSRRAEVPVETYPTPLPVIGRAPDREAPAPERPPENAAPKPPPDPGDPNVREVLGILAEFQALLAGNPDIFVELSGATNAQIEALIGRLRALGPGAVHAIFAVIDATTDQASRAFLIRGAAAIGGPEVVEGFRSLLAEDPGDYRTKAQVIRNLGSPEDPVVRRMLLDALRNERNDRARILLIRALSQAPPAEVAPFIAEIAAAGGDLNLRLEAINTLGDLRDPSTVPALESLIRQPGEIYIRQRAIDAYQQVAGEAAVPLLDELISRETNERILASAIHALGMVGGTQARAVLDRIRQYHADDQLRGWAEQAIQILEHRQELPAGGLGNVHIDADPQRVPRVGD